MGGERKGKGSYRCWVTVGGSWKAFKAQELNNNDGFQTLWLAALWRQRTVP